mmetsp:Transcript_12885/g.39768  ORF Transcript_12885/g.39768 Transcript_12885/m.39768 type:complete len:258 (-) Transcript_12885:1626-2399(-)
MAFRLRVLEHDANLQRLRQLLRVLLGRHGLLYARRGLRRPRPPLRRRRQPTRRRHRSQRHVFHAPLHGAGGGRRLSSRRNRGRPLRLPRVPSRALAEPGARPLRGALRLPGGRAVGLRRRRGREAEYLRGHARGVGRGRRQRYGRARPRGHAGRDSYLVPDRQRRADAGVRRLDGVAELAAPRGQVHGLGRRPPGRGVRVRRGRRGRFEFETPRAHRRRGPDVSRRVGRRLARSRGGVRARWDLAVGRAGRVRRCAA